MRSVATAPARSSAPCCFLPNTTFRRAETGTCVRASELQRAGGDKLLGPQGDQVLVLRAVKHAPAERDLVGIRIAGESAAFVVTADHRLLTRGAEREPVARAAAEFAEGAPLYDGASFHEVTKVEHFRQHVSVEEVLFEGDAVALAWMLPRRHRQRSTEARTTTTVAVKGKEHKWHDQGFSEKHSFICKPAGPTAQVRSRSAGAPPEAGSLWSVGTTGHNDTQPERCRVCPFHQLYLHNLEGPSGHDAVPCAEGAACRMCHAAHPERPRGLAASNSSGARRPLATARNR